MHKFTRSSYFWNHSCELDTLVNQNSHAAPIRSPVRGLTGFWKSRGLRASVTFFPLPHPAPSTFLLSPHFSRGPNAKTSFARPEFRSHRSGTLATQASLPFARCSLARDQRQMSDFHIFTQHPLWVVTHTAWVKGLCTQAIGTRVVLVIENC